MFEPTYALHAQIAAITATEIVAGERGADFTVDVPTADGADRASTRPSIVFVCSPNNPTGTVDHARRSSALAAMPRPRSARCSSSTRRTASSRRGARSSWSTTTARSSSCARTRRCGRSPRAARLRGRPVVGDRRARQGAAAVHPVGADAARGHDRARLPRRDGAPRRVARRGARALLRGARGAARASPCSVGRELPARSASTATRTISGSDCSTATCSCATSRVAARRSVPAHHDRRPRRERCIPRRARRGPAGGRKP